jgi:hypothetical protein
MKNLFVCILIFTLAIQVSGQSRKDTIAAASFKCKGGYCDFVPMVYEAVTNTMTSTGRFVFLDRSKVDALHAERSLETDSSFVDDNQDSKFFKDLGANYIVTGAVAIHTTPTKVELKNNNGQVTGYKTVYNAYINITLKTINVQTGQVVLSKIINKNNNYAGGMLSGMIGMSSNTPEQAVTKLVGDLQKGKEIKQWVGEAFPVTLRVVKVIDPDKKLILISGGSENGLSEKTDVKIVMYEKIEMDGKQKNRTIEVAQGKIQKIEDADFSEVKVKNNWDAIVKNLADGQKLSVITTNLK